MKILIIKLSSLGDIVHSLPVLTQLRKAFPQASIDWLVSHKFTKLLLGHPQINKLYSLSSKIAEWPALIRELSTKQFDYVLDLQGLMKSGLIAKLTRSRRIIGLSPAREPLCEFLWTERIQSTEILNPQTHVLERTLDILKSFSIEASLSQNAKENFQLPVLKNLPEHLQNSQSIVCAPESRWQSKNWPNKNWIPLLHKLLKLQNYTVVQLGTEKGISLNENNNSFIDLTGQTSLEELKSILPKASLVIGSDSGLLHLASAYGVKTLGLYGPTSPKRTGPWMGNFVHLNLDCSPCHKRKCPMKGKNELKCLKELSVESVFEKACEILK